MRKTKLLLKSTAVVGALIAGSAFAADPASHSTLNWQSVFGVQLAKDSYVSCAQRAKDAKEYCLIEMGYDEKKCEAEYEQKLQQCGKIKS